MRGKTNSFLLFIVLLIVFCHKSFAQSDDPSGILKTIVKVKDVNKKPLNGISIIYTDTKTNQVNTKMTYNGTAEFNLSLNKNYLIVASHLNYYTKSIETDTRIRNFPKINTFYTTIEITLLDNCEHNAAKSHLLNRPIGRIVYNDIREKFVYDWIYTEEQTAEYMEIYESRCGKVEEVLALENNEPATQLIPPREEEKSIPTESPEIIENTENKNAEKEKTEIEKVKKEAENAVVEQMVKEAKKEEELKKQIEIAKVKADEQEKQKAEREEKLRKQIALAEIKKTEQEKQKTDRIIKQAEKTAVKKEQEKNKILAKQEEKSEQVAIAKSEPDEEIIEKIIKPIDESPKEEKTSVIIPTVLKNPKFDQTKEFIYLQPRNSWPSELRNYILDSNYTAKPIGTYAYTDNEVKKEFFISDVTELKLKFPKEFNDAFPNWDYVIKTFSDFNDKKNK